MNRLRRYRLRTVRFLARYAGQAIFLLSLVMLALSVIRPDYEARLRRQVARVERSLHKRENLAEKYAYNALAAADRDWVDFDDMPEDIVLYCYQSDTMKCWTHQFPISNDEVDVYPYSYRLQFMSSRNLYSTPLAYIGVREKYINLGSAWYVVTTSFSQDRKVKVVTGIMVKTEYPTSAISNQVNRHLRLRDGYTAVPITEDDTAIVYGVEGEPLFSIVPTVPPTPGHLALTFLATAWFSAKIYRIGIGV